jgi:hypothetical protein
LTGLWEALAAEAFAAGGWDLATSSICAVISRILYARAVGEDRCSVLLRNSYMAKIREYTDIRVVKHIDSNLMQLNTDTVYIGTRCFNYFLLPVIYIINNIHAIYMRKI